jgi:hypothetical protein
LTRQSWSVQVYLHPANGAGQPKGLLAFPGTTAQVGSGPPHMWAWITAHVGLDHRE